MIATAILDRLLHHAVTLNIRGNSYRLKEKLKAGLVRTEEAETRWVARYKSTAFIDRCRNNATSFEV